MPDDASKHRRRSIRLKEYDYSQAGAYFVTICTHNRVYLFGEIVHNEMVLSMFGKIAYQNWLEISKRFVDVQLDTFVVMPNHIHGVIVVTHHNRVRAIPA